MTKGKKNFIGSLGDGIEGKKDEWSRFYGVMKDLGRVDIRKKVISVDRSFVRDRSDVGVRLPSPLSASFSPSAFFTLSTLLPRITPLFFSLFERVRHHCVLHRRLSYTESLDAALLFVAIRDEET